MSMPSGAIRPKRRVGSVNMSKLLVVYILAAIAMRVASGPTANASYIAIALFAFFGRTQAIQALTFSWVFTMLNTALVPEASMASLGRYLIIVCAAVSVGFRGWASGQGGAVKKLSVLTFLLGILLLAHSALFSAYVDVSVLKVLSWVIVTLTLLSAWQGLRIDERVRMYAQLQGGLVLLLLLSLPLLAVPAIGYAVNGTGFQGLLNQPQAFGPTIAVVGAMVGGRVMGDRTPRWRDIAMLLLALVLVVLSEARTAGLALVLGLLISALVSPQIAGVSRREMLPGLRSRRFQVIWVSALIAIFVAGPLFIDPIVTFLYKRSDQATLLGAADASRGPLVQRMMANIADKPLTGIGFGIASVPAQMVIDRDRTTGLPLSAQVEKGVMPVAVLEELGLLGGLAVFAWLWVVVKKGARAGASQFAVLITLLLVNLGESMYFSVGGMGMLLLVLTTGAVVGERSKKRGGKVG
jgi:hypothetical protein